MSVSLVITDDLVNTFFPKHAYFPNRTATEFLDSTPLARMALLAATVWECHHGGPAPCSLTQRSFHLVNPHVSRKENLTRPAVLMAECYLPATKTANLGCTPEAPLTVDQVIDVIQASFPTLPS